MAWHENSAPIRHGLLSLLSLRALFCFGRLLEGQVGVIAAAAVIGVALIQPSQDLNHEPFPITIGRRTGIILLGLFFGLLMGLPALLALWPNHWLALVNAFYRAGSLVFGGGHIVLPSCKQPLFPTIG